MVVRVDIDQCSNVYIYHDADSDHGNNDHIDQGSIATLINIIIITIQGSNATLNSDDGEKAMSLIEM